MTFFRCKFGFGKCFGASSQSNHWAGHHWLLCKTHFWSQVRIWSRNCSLLSCRIREDNTSKWQFFFFFDLQSIHETPMNWDFHFSYLLQMPNYCRMVNTEFFSNFLCSCKKINVKIKMIALSWSLSTPDSQPLCSSSSRLPSPLQNFLNYHCTVRSLAVPRPEALWCWELSLLFYHPFWIWVRKSLESAFCLTSSP